MKWSWFGISAFIVICMLGGCGPLYLPMPARLDPAQQARVDSAWNSALDPINRLVSQALLDALIASQAYQAGVDRLSLYSEKKCAAGTVVMEVHYDRFLPIEDRFSFTLLDDHDRVLRKDIYNRDQIENTYRELYVETAQLEKAGELTEQQRLRLRDLQARVEACVALFPIEKDQSQ